VGYPRGENPLFFPGGADGLENGGKKKTSPFIFFRGVSRKPVFRSGGEAPGNGWRFFVKTVFVVFPQVLLGCFFFLHFFFFFNFFFFPFSLKNGSRGG